MIPETMWLLADFILLAAEKEVRRGQEHSEALFLFLNLNLEMKTQI